MATASLAQRVEHARHAVGIERRVVGGEQAQHLMVEFEARSLDGYLDVDGRGITQSDPTFLLGGGDWDVVAVLARSCYAHEKNVDRGTTLGLLDPCLVANDLYEREVRHEHICGVLHDAHLTADVLELEGVLARSLVGVVPRV